MIDRRLFSLSLLTACALPARVAGAGQRSPGVIELFTSQGCSSCPPADALMLELAKLPDVIPLTFPVEIWDYLGWKDTLAKPAFTARQKAYAGQVAERRVFTPQAVVNGKASCVGSDNNALSKLRDAGVNGAGGRLQMEGKAEGWQVSLQGATGEARLLVLPLITRREVKIGRGENSGRTITYAHVVRDIRDAGPIAPGRVVNVQRMLVEAPEADAFALLAQAGTLEAPGMILAAALVEAGGIKA